MSLQTRLALFRDSALAMQALAGMNEARLFLVTGKGGAGKSTVAASLARLLAQRGSTTLLVQTARDDALAHLFGVSQFGVQPQRLQPSLFAVRVDPLRLLESFVRRLLPVPWLARRLLASTAFRALSAAAPGVSEFLLLERLEMWVDPGLWHRRERYQKVVVDGPATGHMLHLLRAPRQLLSLVPSGPLHRSLLHCQSLLSDPQRTRVVLVSLPEEMAVQEAIEASRVIASELLLALAKPVMNRVPSCPFKQDEIARIQNRRDGGPLDAAARYVIERHALAQRWIDELRTALGQEPVLLPELDPPPADESSLKPLLRALRPIVEQGKSRSTDLAGHAKGDAAYD